MQFGVQVNCYGTTWDALQVSLQQLQSATRDIAARLHREQTADEGVDPEQPAGDYLAAVGQLTAAIEALTEIPAEATGKW